MYHPFRKMVLWIMRNCLSGFDTSMSNAVAVLTCQTVDAGTVAGAFSISQDTLDEAWTFVAEEVAENVIEPFCLIILAICVLIELANTAMKLDSLRWEHGLRVGVKMCLAMVCMDVAPSLLQAIYTQASSWIAGIGDTSISMGALLEEWFTVDMFGDIGFGGMLAFAAVAILCFVFYRVCGIIIVCLAIARIFEILIYVAVSPIPCAFFPFGGEGGLGISRITMNFFKNYIAVCLRGLLMVVCLQVYNIIVDTAVSDYVSSIVDSQDVDDLGIMFNLGFMLVLLSLTLIIVIMQSSNWARSIIDAH